MAIRQTIAETWEVDHYWFDCRWKAAAKAKDVRKYKDAVAYEKEALAGPEAGIHSTVEGHGREKGHGAGSRRASPTAPMREQPGSSGKTTSSTTSFRRSARCRYRSLNDRENRKAGDGVEQESRGMVVNRVLRTLTNIMAEAKRYGVIKDNPAAEAERLREETT